MSQPVMQTGRAFSRFKLPGFNLPLNFTPGAGRGEGKNLFRTALNTLDAYGDGKSSHVPMTLLPTRELTMLAMMDAITDKLSWEKKIFDDKISNKWKKEATADKTIDVTEKMANVVVEELRYRAESFKKSGAWVVFKGDVVKSDTAVPLSVKEALQAASRKLSDIPEINKDWHPRSDGKVLDLVHPSLFPLIYGKSRILSNEAIGLAACSSSCAKGITISIPPDEETCLDENQLELNGCHSNRNCRNTTPYSKNFQWLPSDISLSDIGKPKFASYINNLHPYENKELYSIIEEVVQSAIPLWNLTLTPLVETSTRDYRGPRSRFKYEYVEYDPDPEAMPEEAKPQQQAGENCDDFEERQSAWAKATRRVVLPEPEDFRPMVGNTPLDLVKAYAHRGLQIIVKLANIELTPDNPRYDGGSWHVEGQMNEHICATALYYYDSKNITHSRLAFRQQFLGEVAEQIGYSQDEHEFMEEVFGVTDDCAIQEVGSVACNEGRLLTFPNLLQHQVQPFQLADPTKPGHRKILALFLVDPGIRIISTANVPPQQKSWWADVVPNDAVKDGGMSAALSTELKDQIFSGVDDFPISIEEAKKLRLKLMEERSVYQVKQNEAFTNVGFSLCEH